MAMGKTYEELAREYQDVGEYIAVIANRYFPDSDGEYLYDSIVGFDVFREIENGNAEFPFTDEKYYNSASIQDSLDAFGLDCDKFLYALKFVHHVGESKFVDAIKLHETYLSVLKSMEERLGGEDAEIVVSCRGKRKCTVTDAYLLSVIRKEIRKLYIRKKFGGLFSCHHFNGGDRRVTESVSKRMAYEAELLKYLIDTKATGQTDCVHQDEGNPYFVSRDRLLLISRLMYLTGLTDNAAYDMNTDNIKGVIHTYGGRDVMTVSGKYII